ncbi:uncharacterized protein LOC127851354 isoform X2 [Dreissena polymorpha]|uniref:uncharacterized protein LOC127851354 isoform X2 n=1 Tax=Dreissena polymorpha TaxID=45954 RepID=UPI002263AFD4|nr:uncharacterized protein LOC127851354 isoform X2 [Dreissena polymorpha]
MARKQGDVVISVNVGKEGDKDAKFPYRKGAEKEKANLEKVFVDHFKFEYLNRDVLNDDLSRTQWDHDLDEVRMDPNRRTNCDGKCLRCLVEKKADPKSKYFVLALTSHGYTSDGELNILMPGDNSFLALTDVIMTLKSSKKLEEKIVIIIVDACRVTRDEKSTEDPGISVVCAIDTPPNVLSGAYSHRFGEIPAQTSGQSGMSMTNLRVLPAEHEKESNQLGMLFDLPENYIVINGTTANRPSYRCPIKGSWCEDALVEEVQKYVNAKQTETTEVNFLQLLTKTNQNVAEREVRSPTVQTTAADAIAKKELAKGNTIMQVEGRLECPQLPVDVTHTAAGVKGAETPCLSHETTATASTNVVSDHGATVGSKCCIQIVHRLTETITFKL